MPDRDKEALQARNKDTLLTTRVPAGLKPRVAEAAKQARITISAFVVAAIEDKLQGRDGGKTAPAGNGKGGTTARKPRTRPAPPPVTFSDGEPQQAPRRAHAQTCTCMMCKPKESKR